uniref:rRNA adenine N(6)-methyltransferase n=1 Tax=Syphacia muris TaxID=451379 RepID=A0A0N5AXR4_9BILA
MAKSFSRLPPLPSLRDFIHMYKLRAKKVLSQNFLMDLNLTRKIVRQAGIKDSDAVVEVGPGPGGITRSILETNCKRLDVIEIDHRFIPALQLLAEASDSRLFIHHKDVLKTNIGNIWQKAGIKPSSWIDEPPPLHIIGNLPFNISTPLIIKFLYEISEHIGPWSFGRVQTTLTFQKEVAERLCGIIDSDERSRISIMAQYLTQPKILFNIPGSCFVPKPEVDATVVRFVPRIEPLIKCSFKLVEKFCRQVFHYRRKYVLASIKTLYPKELGNSLGHEVLSKTRIDPTIQCTKLGVEQFAEMCLVYEEQCQRHPGLFLYDHVKPKPLDELAKLPNALPPVYKFSTKISSEGVSLSSFDSVFR